MIVREGRTLHHCVGGDNYLQKHADGISYILMLRKKEDQETPYITVEIRADGRSIVQWYGAFDRKPDKEQVEKWLKEWLVRGKESREEEELAERMRITA